MAIHNKLKIKKAPVVIPDHTKYLEFLSKDFDFLDDSRLTPSIESFETSTRLPFEYKNSRMTEEDFDGYYRAVRDSHLKFISDNFPIYFFRREIKSYPINTASLGRNSVNYYTEYFNELPKLPTVNTLFYPETLPTKKIRMKIRNTMLEDCKLIEGINDYVYIVNNWDPETQSWISSELTQQLDNELTSTNNYFDILNNIYLGNDPDENTLDNITSLYADVYNYYTNSQYYPDASWTGNDLPEVFAISPGEILGCDDIQFLPEIKRNRDIPESGNPGDMFAVNGDIEGGLKWDPAQNKWVNYLLGRDIFDSIYAIRNISNVKRAKLMQLSYTFRPFTWAAYYIPKYKMERDIL